MLYAITGTTPDVILSMSAPAAAVAVGGSLDFNTLLTVTASDTNPAWREVTWSIAEMTPDGGRMAGNEFGAISINFDTETDILTPMAEDAGKWFTITAMSVKDQAKIAECTVYVPEDGKSVAVAGTGGNMVYYVDNGGGAYQKIQAEGLFPHIGHDDQDDPRIDRDRRTARHDPGIGERSVAGKTIEIAA